MPLAVVLMHYPMVNKRGQVVATSVTNFDVHDIARACRTFGVQRYFVVTPVALQRDFVQRILNYWREGEGVDYNPTRGSALEDVVVLPDLNAVSDSMERDFGAAPLWIMTSARAAGPLMKMDELRSRLAENQNLCLVFGTGHGLHPEVLELADAILEPIHGPTDFNHLSVRSAVSIYLDRLFGR